MGAHWRKIRVFLVISVYSNIPSNYRVGIRITLYCLLTDQCCDSTIEIHAVLSTLMFMKTNNDGADEYLPS
jgi:hypothetical protein